MKRVILRVVVMLLTFALGIVVDWLIVRRAVNNNQPPCKVEAVSPAPLAPPVAPVVPVATVAPLPAATPMPNFFLDYDPETFNPYGMFYMMGPKPKEFANFQAIELALFGYPPADPGYISVFTRDADDNSDAASAVFALVTERRLVFATSQTRETGVEYRFEGEFLRTDFKTVAGKNKAVLRGVLTRSKNGRKLVERTVSFRMEHHGC
jgi:hypothetical protein